MQNTDQIPSIVASEKVPTEYDVEVRPEAVVLMDDRARTFSAPTLEEAFLKAESAQDPNDSIHHPPFPHYSEAPLPSL